MCRTCQREFQSQKLSPLLEHHNGAAGSLMRPNTQQWLQASAALSGNIGSAGGRGLRRILDLEFPVQMMRTGLHGINLSDCRIRSLDTAFGAAGGRDIASSPTHCNLATRHTESQLPTPSNRPIPAAWCKQKIDAQRAAGCPPHFAPRNSCVLANSKESMTRIPSTLPGESRLRSGSNHEFGWSDRSMPKWEPARTDARLPGSAEPHPQALRMDSGCGSDTRQSRETL